MTLAPFSSRQRFGAGRLAPRSRWDTRREIEDMSTRLGQLMNDFFGGPVALPGAGTWPALAPIDIEETDDAYVVDIDLPNIDPGNVDIEMRGEELRITGTFEQRQRGGVMRRQDRQAGEFEYQVDLPSDIDRDQVNATYRSGVLTVTVARAKAAAPHKIEIRTQK